MAPKLRLNIAQADPSESVKAVQTVSKRKVAATETIDEAWVRILAMKNSDADQAKLFEVKAAMAKGLLGRNPSLVAKRFSKAEALRMHKQLAEERRESKLKELVANTPSHYTLVDSIDKLQQMADAINAADIIAFDCETFGEKGGALDPWRGNVAGFSVSTREASWYVPLNHTEKTALNQCDINDILGIVAVPLMTTKIVMHNAPFDCKWFEVKYGLNLTDALYADTRIMAMSMDENRDHRLKNLLTDWLKQPSDNFDELFPKTAFNTISLEVALPYAAGDTEKTLALFDWISKWYDKRPDLQEIKQLFYEIEMPVCRQFIKSDVRGIRFDSEAAAKLDAQFATEQAELMSKIHRYLGAEINLNSPTQLKKKLFVELEVPDLAKGSTAAKVLKRIKNSHPVIPLLLENRGLGKLRESFTQKLPHEVKSDGKIHPWHNTWGAATGRFTCKDPNTQQIPAKRPEVRQLFLATDNDRILVSIDYSQIELRVLAHMANEKELIKAFFENRDIHSTTAAMISAGKYTYEDIEAAKDTDGSEQQKLRKQAKVVNFGIVYGMSAGGLSNTLEITKKEAQIIIDNYFKGYPGIERYMDEQKRIARKQGYVTGIFGRKRRLHTDYKSKDRYHHFRADRQAGNFPIQESAGTILKKAVVDLQPVLSSLDTHILLQVHDELLFDCPKDISRENLTLIKETMEKAVKLIVPVRCDVELNPERWLGKVSEDDWYEGEDE
ncbi:DNA polymerase [Cytobacillus purgationiresistens]|uniref:DNA polymerase I n=1 Tax=Cytobacillus purgationiresistens TaxID=863449 RepID=A0ABU0AK37_9BACI|nr:DNA polymerase [Cytobacillus purgationiresistens]MDQ0270768.1 DNA polymerase-1 [Cytobacillus purgationiresistens]